MVTRQTPGTDEPDARLRLLDALTRGKISIYYGLKQIVQRKRQGGMLSGKEIIERQDQCTRNWHGTDQRQSSPMPTGSGTPSEGLLDLVADQHGANFDLWHIEDEARAPGANDAQIAVVKRRIDSTNQRRNDLAEGLDQFLLGLAC